MYWGWIFLALLIAYIVLGVVLYVQHRSLRSTPTRELRFIMLLSKALKHRELGRIDVAESPIETKKEHLGKALDFYRQAKEIKPRDKDLIELIAEVESELGKLSSVSD